MILFTATLRWIMSMLYYGCSYPLLMCSSSRRVGRVATASVSEFVVLFGCSKVVLICFTCPAITVGTVILRALDRVRERALGLLWRGLIHCSADRRYRLLSGGVFLVCIVVCRCPPFEIPPTMASVWCGAFSLALAASPLHEALPTPTGLAEAMRASRSRAAGPFSGPPAAGSVPVGQIPMWPEQIHQSVTGRPGEHVIEWVSGAPRGTSMVQISDEPGCCDSVHCGCFPYWW